MDIRKLQRAIVDGLEDVKAQDIAVFNTEHLSPLFERVIVASGTSNRQTKALASSVRESVKSRGLEVLRTEGEENGEWIIVDCGAAVCHVMQPAIREYYRLEEIWGGKPVKMKLGGVQRGLPKGSEGAADEDEDDTPAPAVVAPAAKRGRGSSASAAPGRPTRDKGGPSRRRAQAGPDEVEYAPERPEVDPPARKRPARPAPGQASAAPASRKAAAKTVRRGVTTSSGSGRSPSAASSRASAGTGTPARKAAAPRPRRSGPRAEESAVRTVVVAPPKTAATGGGKSGSRPAASPSRSAPKPVSKPAAKPVAKPAGKTARPAAKSAPRAAAGARRKP